jgi:hypothetical protein
MNINTAFPSKYLKGAEMEGDTVYTIDSVTIENVGSSDKPEAKPVVMFRETEKGLVLNKTNANTIAGLYGPDTDGWAGKPITLFATEVDFQGQQTLAIRVRMKRPQPSTPSHPPSSTPSGNGDPAKAALMLARQKAWDAYKAPFNGASNEEITPGWREALRAAVPGKQANDFTIGDWNKVLLKVTEPVGASVLDGAQEFKDDDIPF